MSATRSTLHATAAASAGLAASICMAISQVLSLVLGVHLPDALLIGLSLSSIAFGGTYAGAFFTAVVLRRAEATHLPA
jgi:hypothetical protein